jgi:hypothetical protein
MTYTENSVQGPAKRIKKAASNMISVTDYFKVNFQNFF